MKKENLAMLCDFYEFTMANGYFKNGYYQKNVYFDVFFRKVPDNGGFAVAAGLEQVIDYIRELHFEEEDIAYLRKKGIFDEGRAFWRISVTFGSAATYSRCRRARRCSRMSR